MAIQFARYLRGLFGQLLKLEAVVRVQTLLTSDNVLGVIQHACNAHLDDTAWIDYTPDDLGVAPLLDQSPLSGGGVLEPATDPELDSFRVHIHQWLPM